MRPGVSLAFCFAVLLIAGAAAAASPQPVPHGAVAFWNAKNGLVGSGYAFCPSNRPCGQGTIQATTDGGKTWKVLLKTPDPVTQIDTVGQNLAWAVTKHCASLVCRTRVWHTANKGATWQLIGRGLNAVSFATPTAGLGIHADSRGGKVYRSDNGGRSWRPVKSPCPTAAPLTNTVSLVTPQRGFVICTGQAAAGAENKAVFETRDGGRSWTRKSRAELGSGTVTTLPSIGFVTGAAFTPSGYGPLCLRGNLLLVTRNAASTWTPLKVVRPRIDTCSAVNVIPGATYAIVTTRNRDRLVVSTNGGGKWTVVKRF